MWVALFSDWDSGDSNYLLVVLGIFGAVIAQPRVGWGGPSKARLVKCDMY